MAIKIPYSASEVESILVLTNLYASEFSRNYDDSLLKDLEGLRNIVAKQEEAFFNSIKCKGVNELSNKLQYWNNNSISNNLLNLQAALTDFVNNIPKDNVATINAFLETVNKDLIKGQESQQFLSQFKSRVIGPTFYGELAKIINKTSNIKFKESMGKTIKPPNARTGLFKLMTKLQLKTSQKNGSFSIKPNVQITEEMVPNLVSKSFLKRMEKYCEDKGVNLIGSKATELLQDYLDSVAPKYLYAPYYSYYLMLKPSLTINASTASIVGFIGELRAAFQFIDIFGTDKISMVGSLTKLGSGEQVPIDMIFKEGCEMFGFQVKNYTVSKNNTIRISNTLSAKSFVDERLSLNGEIGDILKSFFGTYQFNQPFKKSKDQSKVAEYDKDIYSKFPDVFDRLKTLFDERVGDILKVRDNFVVEGKDNPFNNKQMYYNSFFIIGSRIISSSSILDNMIDSIKKSITNQTANILSRYTMSGPKESPTREHAQINKDKRVIIGENFDDLASKINITYRITIRI